MASLRRLPNKSGGKYYARIRLNGQNEKLLSLKTTNLHEAKQRIKLINEREFLVIAGLEKQVILNELPTVGEAIELFLQSKRNLSNNTIAHYTYSLMHFQKVVKPNVGIDNISKQALNHLMDYLIQQFVEPTVNSYLKGINAFLNWLKAQYSVELPPIIKKLKIERKLPEFLNPDELDKIYDLVEDPKMLATFKVYEHSGIRLRELHNCELDEMISGNYIKLRKTKAKQERIVPIPPEIAKELRLAKFGPWKHDPDKKEPYSPDFISKSFSRFRNKAGVAKNKTIHSLRHTFALRKLLELGNIYLVSQMLGHSDIKTTTIYLQFPDGYLREIFEKWIPETKSKKPIQPRANA